MVKPRVVGQGQDETLHVPFQLCPLDKVRSIALRRVHGTGAEGTWDRWTHRWGALTP